MQEVAGIKRRTGSSTRARSGAADEAASSPAPDVPPGRLIVVLCADPGRLDLVLQCVGRRMQSCGRLTFAEPVTTRHLPAGGGILTRRSSFAALDRNGALAMLWQSGGQLVGHLISVLARLASGETIVMGAARGTQGQISSMWHDVRMIHLETGTEGLRTRLAGAIGKPSKAILPRQPDADASSGHGEPDRRLIETFDCRLRDRGDLAATVVALSNAIKAQMPALASASTCTKEAGAAGAAGLSRGPGHSGNAKSRREPNAPILGAMRRADKPQARIVSAT